jgi:hypothetical protein
LNLDEYGERRAAFDAWQSTHDENYDDNYKNYDDKTAKQTYLLGVHSWSPSRAEP